MKLVVTGTSGVTLLSASTSHRRNEVICAERKRHQSTTRPSSVESTESICSQSVYVCAQKPVHQAWFRASSDPYFARSHSRKAALQSGQ